MKTTPAGSIAIAIACLALGVAFDSCFNNSANRLNESTIRKLQADKQEQERTIDEQNRVIEKLTAEVNSQIVETMRWKYRK